MKHIFILLFLTAAYTLPIFAEDNSDSTEKQTIKLISLPELTEHAAQEIVNALKEELSAKGYKRKNYKNKLLAELPENITNKDTFTRKLKGGTGVIRFGIIKYITRPSRMWIESVIIKGGKATANKDVVDLLSVLEEEILRDLELEEKFQTNRKPAVLVALPPLNKTQLDELVEAVKLEISLIGYKSGEIIPYALPSTPERITNFHQLSKSYADKIRVIRLGIIPFATRSSKLWIEGVELSGNGSEINQDLGTFVELINKTIIPDLMSKRYKVDHLAKKVIQLSFSSSKEAITGLKSQGYSAFNNTESIPTNFSFDQLPIILEMPEPNGDQTGLVGEGISTSNKLGASSLSSAASKIDNETVSTQFSKLLIVYHPEFSKQLTNIERGISELIDKPARQVLIEGMVLEISESGLKELGVEWELSDGANKIAIEDGDSASTSTETFMTMNLDRNFTSINPLKDWKIKLKALINSGKAEILSRPSVLTLNNRQATIRVGEDEPIAQTVTNDNSTSTSFSYLPTGILLNVRPRISADGDVVSMAIDTTVSQKGDDVKITDPGDDAKVLAQAPRISTRRVQTYATITNNTPFIIGGLIARDNKESESKAPFLGDLPFIGSMFNSNSKENSRREVIIVLTPYVLPEQDASRSTPKDDQIFDTIGNNLFRSSYRIKKSDLADLSFLTDNPRVKELRTIAQQLADSGSPLAQEEPYSLFVNGHFPGESTIIQEMIYRLIKKMSVHDQMDENQLQYFKLQENTGYIVQTLNDELKKMQKKQVKRTFSFWDSTIGYFSDEKEEQVFDPYADNDRALAITFKINHDSLDTRTIFKEPIPEVSLVECETRNKWEQELASRNKSTISGRSQHTILINNEDDITRLKIAIMMKEIIKRNGGRQALTLQRFKPGKQLLLPDIKKDEKHFIDAEVARYFAESKYYYPKLIESVELSLGSLIASFQNLFLRTNYEEHGLTREQLSKIGLAIPIDIFLKANRPKVSVPYTRLPITVDGNLREPIWNSTRTITDFTIFKKKRITDRTQLNIAYDEHYLYFGFRCIEPAMNELSAHAENHDGNQINDDHFAFFIDANRDKKTFFQINVNTNNAVMDFKRDNTSSDEDDMQWKAEGLKTAIKKKPHEWTGEVAIPWTSLNVRPRKNRSFGFFANRYLIKDKEIHQFPFLNGSSYRTDFYGILRLR